MSNEKRITTNMNDKTETAEEQSHRLQAVIEHDLDRAFYNTDLKRELDGLPTWQLDAIFANVLANAGFGQRTRVRLRVNALQRALRDVPVPGGYNEEGNV